MKTKTITLLAMLFALNFGLFAQVNVLDFEDEDATSATIGDLHTGDWQTNTAYTRNTYALNPDKTGVDQTNRCATFSGYNSDGEWWYGMDIVLATPITLTSDMTYLHAEMMTNNTSVDTNRGLLLRSSAGGGTDLKETWQYITDTWADYVFPIPSGAADLMELRFMFNHKTAGEITYLDEILINNDPNPRTLSTGFGSIKSNNSQIKVYSGEKSINVISSLTNTNVEVYNLLGKRVFSQNISGNQITIPVNETGIYLVRCNQCSKKVCVK
jgi:hypothetical protein